MCTVSVRCTTFVFGVRTANEMKLRSLRMRRLGEVNLKCRPSTHIAAAVACPADHACSTAKIGRCDKVYQSV